MQVYFDNAATTPIAPEVVEAILPVLQHHFGNPSSIHSYGRQTKALIEQARKTVAKALNCAPSEIFFTSGGTEADNQAIVCGLRSTGIRRAITSPLEHHAVLHTLEHMAHTDGIELVLLHVLPNGHVDLDQLEQLLATGPRTFVSLMHGNNEIGNMLDLERCSALCTAHHAVLHVDTVQTIGYFPIDLQATPIDFITGAAHKFNGPKGVGFLYINGRTKIAPFIHGGAQERNMRGGTENVYGIVGLAKALELAVAHLPEKRAHIEGLKHRMLGQIKEAFPEATFNGDAEGNSLYTVLNVAFPPSDMGEALLMLLDIDGIAASAGSACSSGSDVGSHVLRALGTDMRRPCIRFSFGQYNTAEEVDYVVQKLVKILQPTPVVA